MKEKTQKELAKEYRVSTRTIRNWRDRGINVQDPAAVAALLSSQQVNSPKAIKALSDQGVIESLGLEFPELSAELDEEIGGIPEQKGRLQQCVALFNRAIKKAAEAGDVAMVNNVSKQLRVFEQLLLLNLATSAKLKLEVGETVSRAKLEQIVTAMRLCAFRGVNVAIEDMAPKLVGLTDPREVFEIIQPYMVYALYVTPFEGACGKATDLACENWVVDELKKPLDYVVKE